MVSEHMENTVRSTFCCVIFRLSLIMFIFSFALNYKGLSYRTEWVEYPDIEATCKRIGAKPTWNNADGSPLYTLPVIYDPSTDTVLADSTAIADYLDETYPDTPRLFPPGTRALQAAFQSAQASTFGRREAMYKLVVLAACLNLNEPSYEYFRRTREEEMGKRLEDIAPEGMVREQAWQEFEEDWLTVGKWYKAGGDGPFIMGDAPCHADMVIAARLMWARQVFGKQSASWARIIALDGGRWARFMQNFEQYSVVV